MEARQDMTAGKPWKLILWFLVPILLGNLFQNLYSIIDSMIVGRLLGMEAFAAVGVTSAQGFIVYGWIGGMTSGFSIVFAQEYGAKNLDGVKHYFVMAAYLCAAMCILMTVGLLAGNSWILQLMKTPDNIFGMAKTYIGIIYVGILPSIAYNLFGGILKAFGDSKTPLKLLILSSVINIILDFVLIGWFHMGVEGAAYATVIAQSVSAVLCFVYVKNHYGIFPIYKEERRITSPGIARLLKIGTPMALQFSITGISVMIVQGAINSFGAVHIAAISTVGKIQGVIGQPMVALGAALSTYVGQNFGARNMKRVSQGVRVGFLYCMITGAMCTAVILLWGSGLVGIFIKGDTEVITAVAKEYFFVIAWFYIPLSLIYVYRNALQGMGEGLVPFLGGISELLARIIAIFLLVKPLGFYGIILSDPLAWMFALLTVAPYYYYRMKREERHGRC